MPSFEEVLNDLVELEARGVRGCHVTADGIFKYHYNMPTYDVPAIFVGEDHGIQTWEHPRSGDVLISFKVEGVHDFVEIFQYDWIGSRKVIYWSGHCDGHIAPFTDGIPLLQVGKPIYIKVYHANKKETSVNIRYAVLDGPSRKELSIWHDGDHGVKLMHQNGKLYKAYNVFYDWSYSPNTLALCDDQKRGL